MCDYGRGGLDNADEGNGPVADKRKDRPNQARGDSKLDNASSPRRGQHQGDEGQVLEMEHRSQGPDPHRERPLVAG